MTPMEFILRFTFTNPDLDTTIVGTISPEHLQTTSTFCKREHCRQTSTRRRSTVSLLPVRHHRRVANNRRAELAAAGPLVMAWCGRPLRD